MKRKSIYIGLSLLLICFFGCKKYNPALTNINTDFSLIVQDTTGVRDDGTTLVPVVFNKLTETQNGLTVTLTCGHGKLLDSVFTLDSNNMVKTYLRVAQDTGKYFIQATVNMGTTPKAQKTLLFSLRPAMPDSIFFETDSATLHTKTPITIMPFLYRKYGLVSLNTTVSFRAFQVIALNDTVNVGRFTGVLANGSAANGKLANVTFYSDTHNIDTTKMVTIRASVPNDQRKIVYRQVTLGYK
jgi:hypothetical protein